MKIYQNYVYIVQDDITRHGLHYVHLDTLNTRTNLSSNDIYF